VFALNMHRPLDVCKRWRTEANAYRMSSMPIAHGDETRAASVSLSDHAPACCYRANFSRN
jgi:hypothetical protein